MLWMEAFVTAGGLVEVGHNDRGLLWKWHFAHSQYGVCVKRGTTICQSSLRQPVLQLMCRSQSVDKTSTQALVRKAGIAPGIHKGRSSGIDGCHDCERRYAAWSFYSRRFNLFCIISHTDGDILYECWTCMHRIFEHNILCHLNCDVALQCKSIRQRKTSQL